MKHLLERLQNTYNDLKDENEIAIYDKYANIAKRITFIFIGEKRLSFIIMISLSIYFNIEANDIIKSDKHFLSCCILLIFK